MSRGIGAVDVEHFRLRVMQDAFTEAMSAYWLRRAKTFEEVGNERCDAVALACRRHASIVPLQIPADEIADALEEAE